MTDTATPQARAIAPFGSSSTGNAVRPLSAYHLDTTAAPPRSEDSGSTAISCGARASDRAASAGISATQGAHQVVPLQMCDVLLGAASARMNAWDNLGKAKGAVVEHLERRLNRTRLGPTPKSEEKFNIFRIRLGGGW